MNRGDYETLAAALADSDVDDHPRRILAFDLADALTSTNQRFDPVRWLRQCEIGPVSPVEVAQWTSRLAYRVEHFDDRRRACEQRTGVRLEPYSGTVPRTQAVHSSPSAGRRPDASSIFRSSRSVSESS
ncbi:hypothetical protein ACFRH4_03470 [Streptomyces mirabilis]|uniref:hypothetical protein n=1 Tax=Streptomyces mirabilis TaxID=68239 RepID=UPI0036C48EDE